MKKYIYIGISIAVIGIIFFGNYTWNEKVNETVEKAEETIKNPPKAKAQEKEDISAEESNESLGTEKNDNSGKKTTDTKSDTTPPGLHNSDIDETTVKVPNGPTNTDNHDSNKKKSVEEIKGYYYPLFQELEAQETSKVDQLMVQAKADFISHKGTKSEIISKYQGVASMMEQNADRAFNAIYQQLQYDLEYNGHSLNEAQEFQQTYNAKKQERLSRVLSQMKDF